MNTEDNTEDNWRDEAINAALGAAIHYGEGEHLLLAEVRRHLPGCVTVSVYPDRRQLVEFLEKHTQRPRSLLPGASLRWYEDDETQPSLGWYGLEWEGAALEVVLAPAVGNGQCLCLGWDEALLLRFAAALNEYAERPAGRSLRYTEGWESAPDVDAELGKVTWDDIVLPPGLLRQVREAVEGFWQHRATFGALGFSWKRGILLVGPPGTGKTMICKAVAAALPALPFLYVRDLRERNKKEAVQAIFRRARKLSPCILAFEDMDGLFDKDNRTVFLNELDGFQSNDGILIVASSNHPGKIDEALLKRPSRFDRVFHVGLPGPDERHEFCRRLLSRSALAAQVSPSLDIEGLARQVAERTEGFTPAYLKEAFLAAALLRVQEGETRLDDRFGVAVLEQVDELRAHLKRMKDPDALGDMQSGGGTMGLRR